jgi:hypothetical protein
MSYLGFLVFISCRQKILIIEIMQNQEPRTTIALHKETVQRLGEFGYFNESYEDVVNRLISIAKKNKNGGG